MARLCGCERQQVSSQRGLMSGSVRPEGSPGCPICSKAFVVSDRILDDEGLHSLWVCQCHAEANRPTVVLHVKRVVQQAERLREGVHHRGDNGRRCSQTVSGWPSRCVRNPGNREQSDDNDLQAAGAAAETFATTTEVRAVKGSPCARFVFDMDTDLLREVKRSQLHSRLLSERIWPCKI
jgi:hypothetical protein